MRDIHPQYVVDENQQRKAVMLSIDEWEEVVEALEELEDVRAYDEAKEGPQDLVSLEDAVKEIEDGETS